MSPTSGNDVPKTPDRKSSASFLTSWAKNFSLKSKSSNPSLPATSPIPIHNALTSPWDGLADAAQPARTRWIDVSGAESAEASSALLANGGPKEMRRLLANLCSSPEHTLPERVAAADRISDLIVEYPIRNLFVIWQIAEDLWDEPDGGASIVGQKLLLSCVGSRELTPAERRSFFESITNKRGDDCLENSFEALKVLTDNGKDVEALEDKLPRYLAALLGSCAVMVFRVRRREKKVKGPAIAKEEILFSGVLEFIADVAKYNSKVFREDEFELLLEQIIVICKKTNSTADLEGCVKLIGALITYTHVPADAITPCVEVLADIYRQIASLKNAVWGTFNDLFCSHLGHSTVNALLSIMHRVDRSVSEERRVSRPCARGAFEILSKVILRAGKPGIPPVSLNLFVQACHTSLAINSRAYFAQLVRFFTNALSSDELFPRLLEEVDWPELLSLMLECSNAPVSYPKEPSETTLSEMRRSSTPTGEETTRECVPDGLSEAIAEIAEKLNEVFGSLDFVQRQSVIDFFLHLSAQLSVSALETVLNYYKDESLLWLSNPDWLDACRFFCDKLFRNKTFATKMRLRMLDMLRTIFVAATCVEQDSDVDELAILILRDVAQEDNLLVLEELGNFATHIVQWYSDSTFEQVLELLKPAALRRSDESGRSQPLKLSPSRASVDVASSERFPESTSKISTQALVKMFLRTVNVSAFKARHIFDLLLEIAGSGSCMVDARISALKLLFRLRCDANLAVHVNSSTESESIAAVLCRTTATAPPLLAHIEPLPVRRTRSERDSLPTERRLGSDSLYRQNNKKIRAIVQPLWMYPGPPGLPEEPAKETSPVLVSAVAPDANATDDDCVALPLDAWLDVAIGLLKADVDWEVYSYTIVHLGAQLANGPLFMAAIPQIQSLRHVMCEQIKNNSFQEPPGHTSVRKADVAVCIFHILTILIGHHDHFNKSDEDEMVRSFLFGIGGWEATANWCIHALAVSCHELQPSVSKSLENILHKMSQIITQTRVQMHVLEFLAGLSRIPELFKNFREDEYKMVFGICFRFLQSSRDDRNKKRHTSPPSSKAGHVSLRHTTGYRDLNNTSESSIRSSLKLAAESDLPEYVYTLAHHVICFWFLSLKVTDRPKYFPWLIKNLTYTEGTGSSEREVIEERGIVVVDMMQRVAFSERGEETTRDEHFAKPVDGEVAMKSWLVGSSIVTIETAGRTGLSQITVRRPSTTRYSIVRPLLVKPPRHQVYLSTDQQDYSIFNTHYVGVLPDDILQEHYAPLMLCALPYTTLDVPIPLPDDDATKRAVSIFDRNVTVDSHKVGVIYMGDGQTSEEKIFANVVGSADYTSFVNKLGTLVRLKGADFNTQGLDREFDTDGEFTIAWRDRVTELVFHVTTMMVTDLERDPMSINKKRHTGNDFVNIVWNNSGLRFKFDMFPSAFNYVYIVITPNARASFVETRTTLVVDEDDAKSDDKSVLSSGPTNSDDGPSSSHPDSTRPAPERRPTAFKRRYYRVQVLSAPDFPSISPAAEGKIISGRALPHFVRLLALNASVFSHVWVHRDGGEYVSSWRNRLREIKRLREKHAPQPTSTSLPSRPKQSASYDSAPKPPSTPLSSASGVGERSSSISNVSGIIGIGGASDRRPTPQPRDSTASSIGGTFKRMSAMTVLSDDSYAGSGSRTSMLSSAGTGGTGDQEKKDGAG